MSSLRLVRVAAAGLLTGALLTGAGLGRASPLFFYVHTDHLNTPRLIADQNQATVWRWDQTEPFGNNPSTEDPDGNSVIYNMPFRFPGQYFDKETNLHYNYFRDYDPGIGRYVQSDPIGLEGGPNLYSYVGGNPISRTDPSGLLSPNFMMQFLPTPVINQLVNFASYVPPPVAAAALLSALQAYKYTVAVNLATAAGASAAALGAAGYLGYQGGSAINRAIENAYGQNAGGALYDLLHGQAEVELLRNQARNSAQVCRPN